MGAKPFIRVRSLITGHQFDIHRNSFNPEKHERVEKKRYPDAVAPRRPKYHVRLNKKASGPAPVEGSALSVSVGTEKEVEP